MIFYASSFLIYWEQPEEKKLKPSVRYLHIGRKY